MSKLLRLDATDDQVFNLTMRAELTTEGVKPSTALRCTAGGCALGNTRDTPYGPLFTSSWQVETTPSFHVNVNGAILARSATLRYQNLKWPVHNQSGAPITHTERHGCIALIAPPPEVTQDFPDLLARCKHGDVVLERMKVLEWHRAGRAPKVQVSKPFADYAPMRPSSHHDTVRSHEERGGHFGDAAGPSPAEVHAILRDDMGQRE